jgi:hypothetical protein
LLQYNAVTFSSTGLNLTNNDGEGQSRQAL